MKKELYINGEYSGQIGKPVFKDSLGKQLCVGDVVCVFNEDGLYPAIVVDNFVYGWAYSSKNGNFKGISVYKLVNYTQIENLEEKVKTILGNRIEIKKRIKRLTMSELEKIVGEPFEIVKED